MVDVPSSTLKHKQNETHRESTMKALLLVFVIIFMSGCTTYSVKRDGEGMVSVDVTSTRSFEQPNIYYNREGQDVEFQFSAESVDNNTDAFLGVFQGMMGMMIEMMKAQMLMSNAETP